MPPSSDLPIPTASKSEWRAWAREVRAALPDQSQALTAHLAAFLHLHRARRVLAYRALPGEPDVSALAGQFELLAPRARWKPEPHLTLHAWETATELSRFGALQPPASAPRVLLGSVDAVLLPALTFDEQGVRLGYGGGFYDRLLPGFTGLTVGVVWADLIVPTLPTEAHDVRGQWLATELGVRTTRTTTPPIRYS
ncbi:5-formyltetrahydrofolate cyclo-ligase [Deinococcus sp. QL22]|uniref:5-formyltetrahydrofolate cyclo-ligase n=1 Tax=Deinococcus sp. QL22 TaxID=2939437 RepID=UPI002016DE94|nr:5-formyltetrahydrofolate cyclo-ligase [Deinococcus sp. QL22]UQN04915.1 5-formyltetrahydrofolate cyclo-ligase [Deinococcus sp. QL22]